MRLQFFTRILFVWILALSPVAHAETIDDKVFLQVHKTGQTDPLGLEIALAAPPLFPTPQTLILPTLYHVRESQKVYETDSVAIRQVEPGFILTHTLSPRWDILITQSLNWRKISGASFSWHHEITASGVYTLAYYPRNDQRYFYLVGFVLTNDGYRNQLLPALSVVYESEDRSRYFELGAPYSNLLFRLTEKFELGLAGQWRGAYYHVAPGQFAAQDPRTEFLALTSYSIGPSAAYQFADVWFAHFKCGVEFLRQTQQWDGNFTELSSLAPPATWYFKIGVGMRFLDDRTRGEPN